MTSRTQFLTRLALGLMSLFVIGAHASGPRVICGTGVPIKFPGAGSVTLNYDLGVLGTRSKAQADAIVTNAISLWTNVGTSSIVLSRGPDMPEDVTTANLATYYPNNATNTADGLNPVVYDTDGSILDAIFGAGAKNNLLGFATTRFSNCLFQEGTVFISGFKAVSDTTMGVVFAHEVGHLVGMDHTQLDDSQGIPSTANYPLMYPVANRGSVSLHEDDIAGISLLYPDPTLNSVYGQITGTFVLADGVTPVKGANLWATETTTGKVYSVVSDYLKQNTGFFRILLPAGTYTLRAEAVQTAYVGASSVGPYAFALTDPSFQPPMYPSGSGGAPISPVTLGNATPVTFNIAPACTANVTFGINGSGAVGGNCPINAGTLQFTAATTSVAESSGNVTVTVSRINGSDGAASVNFTTAGGTATSGADFTAQSGTLNWAAGDSAAKTISVPIISDALIEGNETFTLTLFNASGATLGATTTMTVTIVDDDFPTPPGAPLNVVVTPADAAAFVAFTPPANNGGSPITNYTASCGAQQASSTSSPLNVVGLANGVATSCSVVAINAQGAGTPSVSVPVTPSASAPLTLVSAVSRKAHGAAGNFDLPIDIGQPISAAVSVEPRFIGSGHTLVFQFNVPVSLPATASVGPPGTGTASVVAANGNSLSVMLSGVADNQRATVTLTGANGGMANFPVSLGFLVGDFNSTRAVVASDIAGAKARLGQMVNDSNFKFDINLSGTIDPADISAAKQRAGTVLP
ncbi:MAG: matrixin family metalloprotease [Betaproteobacteria bacterium]|nr:matrixin family metalloprotease [Betaproteobacteria bacterium]